MRVGIKISELDKNEPRLPVLAEKAEVSSSGEQNRQASSDSGGCPMSKTCDEVDALDSGSPVPAIPSDALLETDNPAHDTSDAACELEMENKQKESSDNVECSPIPAEDGNISEEEQRFPEPPAGDDSNSLVKSVVEEAVCESVMENKQKESSDNLECSPIPAGDINISDEKHRLPEPPAEDDSNSLVKTVVEDAVCEPVVENKKIESPDNLECFPIPAEDGNISDKEQRLPEPPAEEDDSNSTVKAIAEDTCKTEDSRDTTLNSADAPGIENGIPDSSVKTLTCSEKASEDADHSKTLSNGCFESFPGLVSEGFAEVNTVASSADDKESMMESHGDDDIVQDAETDKPNGEIKRSPLADGDVDPPVSSCQAPAQSAAVAAAANHAR